MKYVRLTLLLILVSVVSAGVGAVTPALFAAPSYARYLPTVQTEPVASVCDPSAPILDRDTGSLSVAYRDGVYYVSYQDRADGGQGYLARHEGNHLVEVEQTGSPLADVAPALVPPDTVKVGSVALVVNGPEKRWYYTKRKPGDTTGPYGIWCLRF